MRDNLSKVVTGAMIAGAALLVTACGGGNQANNSATNLDAGVYNAELPTDTNLLGNTDTGMGNGSTGTTGGNMSTTTTGGNTSTTTTTTTTNTSAGNGSAGNNQ